MADHTTTVIADILREAKGPLQENFPKYHVLMDSLQRIPRDPYSGKQVTIPIVLNPLQGGGPLAETGTVNTPQTLRTTQANITMKRIYFPVTITPDSLLTSGNPDTSLRDALGLVVEEATTALARLENEITNQNSDGLLAAITASTNNTTVTCTGVSATAGDNFYPLYVGRVCDIATRSTGVNITNGTARRITAVNTSTGVITFGDGGGNLNVTNAEGVFIQGAAVLTVAQTGIQTVAATSGTFQGVDKAAEPGWQGTDGRSGVTTAVDLSISILDGMEREVGKSGRRPAFYVADERVVDKYGQTLLSASMWQGERGMLETGWSGIRYRDKLVIQEYDFKRNSCYGIDPESLAFYSYGGGPDWDEEDGGMFRRFSRVPTLEAWLVHHYQLGAYRCNTLVFANNLNAAT